MAQQGAVGAVLFRLWSAGTLSTRAVRKSMNPAYRPMLATLVDDPFDDQRWVFETKWDGFRLITEKRGHAIRLWSRNGIDVTTRYREALGLCRSRALKSLYGVMQALRTDKKPFDQNVKGVKPITWLIS